MKKLYFYLSFLFSLIVALTIYSCSKYYINNGFRKTYSDVNEVIHTDTLKNPFFKIHFKNGDVSILENWKLNEAKDTIAGQGKLFDFNRNEISEGKLAFNIDDIAIIETNQLEVIKSKDKERIAALSILTAANVALDVVCITNPKACFGSCPTFYIKGEKPLNSASAEGFSSAISPSLEMRDLDALQYSTSSEKFYLTMQNEAFETHMVNELYVQAVAKKSDEKIYHDKDGTYYRCGELINLNKATVEGRQIEYALSKFDEIEYFSNSDSNDLATTEEIVLQFNNLPNLDYGLVINFRQSLLTTFLLYSGISYMGNEVGDYFAKIETNEQVKKRLSNPFKRLGKIKLSVWDVKLNKWNVFDELYETGPIAKNLMITRVPYKNIENGNLKIKVELVKGLWRLDYLGLTNIVSTAQPYTIYPNAIEVIDGENYTVDYVSSDDNNYLISFPGNEFKFEFKLPQTENANGFELFISSKGYYLEWIRSDWIQNKDLVKLRKMLLNDNKTWFELAQEFKGKEHEMEEVFWNSKYTNLK